MSEAVPPSPLRIPPDATLAAYDRWAAQYDAMANPMVAATAFALRTVPFPVAGQRVVELGCGTGRHADVLLAAGATSFTGVDGSIGMLAVARARHHDVRTQWCLGEVHATSLASASFERALVVLVLEHLPAISPLFAEIARLLVPGGQLRLLKIHADLLALGTNAHFHADGVEHRFTSSCHDRAAIETALAAAGLTITALHEWRADGELLAAVPRLGKHAGRRVLLDVTAARA